MKRSHQHSRSGAAIIETAMVLPVFIMFFFGTFEYGRYLMMQQVLNNAAREGARYALSHTQATTIGGVTQGSADSDVIAKVNSYLGGLQLQGGNNISVFESNATGTTNLGAWQSAQFGEYICVRITGNYRVVGPTSLLLPSIIPVTVRAVMRSEAN